MMLVGGNVAIRIGGVLFPRTYVVGPPLRFPPKRRSGMAVAVGSWSVSLDRDAVDRFRRHLAAILDKPSCARALPSYTKARCAPARPRAPRHEAVERDRVPAVRTDREAGRRRRRSRDFARTGRRH
jgi:hypothetical protein